MPGQALVPRWYYTFNPSTGYLSKGTPHLIVVRQRAVRSRSGTFKLWILRKHSASKRWFRLSQGCWRRVSVIVGSNAYAIVK